ncbi:MAG: hypothetical protein ACK5RL_18635 [Acidimicrobiales bacterium]
MTRPGRMRHRLGAALVALAVAVAGAGTAGGAPPAAAAVSQAPGPAAPATPGTAAQAPAAGGVSDEIPDEQPVDLTLLEQSATTPADGVFTARFELPQGIDLDDPDLTVQVAVHQILDSEAELDEGIGAVLNHRPQEPLVNLVNRDGTSLTIEIPLRPGAGFDELNRVLVPDRGVYPVSLSIRTGSTAIARGTTTLIRLPTEAEAATTPMFGVMAPVIVVGPTRGLSVQEATEVLTAHPDRPLTVAVDGGALADLADNPTAATAFRGAVGDRPVVPIPATMLDPSSLFPIGKHSLSADVRQQAITRSTAVGLLPLPRVAVIDARPTADGVAVLADQGIVTMLQLDGRDPDLVGTMATTDDRTLVMLSADPAASMDLGERGSPTARRQRLLSRLALRGGQPIVVATTKPMTEAEETADALLSALAELSETDLGPSTVSLNQFDPANAAGVIPPAEAPSQDLGPVLPVLNETQAAIATYRGSYVDGPSSPDVLNALMLDALDTSVPDEQRVPRLQAVLNRTNDAVNVISLPDNQAVTLAARSVRIPLTIENNSSGSRHVLLRFRSDKIDVAEDNQLITVGPGTSSIDLQITAHSLGVTPLQVSVFTPDGQRQLATSQFGVRSTSVPGLGLAISGIGLALLAVWWYLSIRRARGRRSAPSGDGTDRPDSDGTPVPAGRADPGEGGPRRRSADPPEREPAPAGPAGATRRGGNGAGPGDGPNPADATSDRSNGGIGSRRGDSVIR